MYTLLRVDVGAVKRLLGALSLGGRSSAKICYSGKCNLRLKECCVGSACEGIFLVELFRLFLVEVEILFWDLRVRRKASAIDAVGAGEELSVLGVDLNIFPTRFLPSAWHQLHLSLNIYVNFTFYDFNYLQVQVS